MRKLQNITCLYLDFDGFFASVMQQKYPALRNKPIGIVPFDGTDRTVIIACSKEAKKAGCKNIMSVREAKSICPNLVLVPQEPDLYRRAHNALLSEISAIIPIDAIKSIDEICCKLDKTQQKNPREIGEKIKARIKKYIGTYITCSIGFAPNRQLAKIAGKQNKPDGITIWPPEIIPKILYGLDFDDIAGIGRNMKQRLYLAGIYNVEQLLNLTPKHMRKIWHNVSGERLWYALNGYEVEAQQSERFMFGHGRVLPPAGRDIKSAKEIARLLLIKAARRLRREGYYTSRLALGLAIEGGSFSDSLKLPIVNDDKALLDGLNIIWQRAVKNIGRTKIFRLYITLLDISFAVHRQLDMFLRDDEQRQKWEAINKAIDSLNQKYSKTIISNGIWNPPRGGNVGGKISYTRIPQAQDFW